MDTDRALCRGRTAVWFSDDPQHQREAKATCYRCPLLHGCRGLGQHEKHGVWGGLTAEERKQKQ